MLIKVTQTDIDNGKHDCYYCPIALAVKRISGACFVRACRNIVLFDKEYEVILDTLLPQEALNFMTEFDNMKSVKPFSFSLQT